MSISENKKVFIYILIAFLFSIAVRLIWVYQFSGTEQFIYNGQLMINTNDGYAYAEGARDMLQGFHQPHDLSYYGTALSTLTYIFAKILPFSFETIILYMPAFLSSLIVIPLVLIGKSLGKVEVGFIAALFGSIVWSYYNRTMVGYYDTDMLNVVFPTFLLWSIILALREKEDKYLLFTGLEIVAYRWWYPQSYSLEFAFLSLIILYVAYQYIKKEDFHFTINLLIFMMFAMMGLDNSIRLMVVILLYVALKTKILDKYLYYFLGASVVLLFITGGISPILAQIKGYIFRESVSPKDSTFNLHFYSVVKTVREAGKIPFETFVNRISGNQIIFILSIIGYIWLIIKRPIMLFGLPMIGLGFLAYVGGLRFTVYAVPVLAFGIAFLIVEIAKFIKDKKIQIGLILVLAIAIIYPNIKHVIDYKVPTVFTKDEVKTLDKLKHIAKREDYVVTWWDYGYPIRYYADVKTLVDGGKHRGYVNFSVSFILTHPQLEAARMARLDVEYTEKRFAIQDKNKTMLFSNIAQMTKDYGFNDVNSFLNSLKDKNFKLPRKTRDIYLYLPNRMMNIYPTITLFSNLDLQTGNPKSRQFFYVSRTFRETLYAIDLGNGIAIDKKTNSLIIGQNRVPIKRFAKVYYDRSGKLQKQIQTINPFGTLDIIFMPNYRQFLVIDDDVYNSLYIQLFVLENYDKNLFEPVIMTPLVKIYRLKI